MKIPAIRGKIGQWTYYSGIMTFEQIANNVIPSINEIYQAQCLDDLLQRAITDNYESITNYILKDDERFFNALILAVYDGDPQWFEVEFPEEQKDYTNVGFLEIEANTMEKFDPTKTTIFPVDGQHRVRGIIEALKKQPNLSMEQIPVIVIAHQQSEDGRKKTRKLFSTLNRRNRAVGKNENIVLDEDDVCSIITRELIQDNPLFSGNRVVNIKGKQIPASNGKAITSLIALYEVVDWLVQQKLQLTGKKYAEYKLYRPNDEEIAGIRKYIFDIMQAFMENMSSVSQFSMSEEENPANEYRNSKGGNIVFRPMAILEIFKAATIISQKRECSFAEAFGYLDKVSLNLDKSPWLGFLWDGTKMISGGSHTIIRYLLLYMVDEDLLSCEEKNKLFVEYAKILKISEDKARVILNKIH